RYHRSIKLAWIALYMARSRRPRTPAPPAARCAGGPCAGQADLARRKLAGKETREEKLDLTHQTRLARRAFQRIAVPLRGIGSGFIGALQKFEQRLIRP